MPIELPGNTTVLSVLIVFSGLVIFGINMYLSVYHMISYFRVRGERESLWLSFISIGLAAYAIGDFIFLTNPFPQEYGNMINKFQFNFSITLPFLFVLFFQDILKVRFNKIFLYATIGICVAFIVLLNTTNHFFTETYAPRVLDNVLFNMTVPEFQMGIIGNIFVVFLAGILGYMGYVAIRAYRNGKIFMRPMFIGLGFILITLLNDILATSGIYPFRESIYLLNIGFAILNVSLAGMITFRHHLMRDEIHELNAELEEKIKEINEYNVHLEEKIKTRTTELNVLNQSLEEQNTQMRWELSVARNVQTSMLPTSFPEHESIQIGVYHRPMLEVSGDYYSVFEIRENQIGILIADVSGHGIPSALITTMVKVAFESYTSQDFINPAEVCKNVNQSLFDTLSDAGYYLTAFFLVLDLDEMKIEYSNAGHEPLYLFRENSDKPLQLTTQGTHIGAFKDPQFSYDVEKLKVGDSIILITDGVIKAQNPHGQEYGIEKLTEFINDNRKLKGQELVDSIVEGINQFSQGNPPNDDRAVLAIDIVKEPSFGSLSYMKRQSIIIDLFNKGKDAFMERNFNEAIRSFDKILGFDKNNVGALFYKSKVFSILKDYDTAEDNLRKVLKIDPEDVQALYLMGMLSFHKRNFETSRFYFEKVRDHEPSFRNTNDYLDQIERILAAKAKLS